MQINRLFGIVYILLNKKRTTAGELAGHFEVSQRTIYRDIEALCEAGIPIYASKGKGGGISLVDGFVLNKSVLSEEDRRDIIAALQGLNATSYPGADHVLSKLGALFGTEHTNWIEIDFSDWSNTQQQKFISIRDAVTGRHPLRFDYYSSYGQKTSRIAEPLQMWFKSNTWYLRAYCRQKQDVRIFKLTRMRNIEVLDETFEQKPGHLADPLQTAAQTPAPDIVDIRLKIDASLSYRVYDEFDEDRIEPLENGDFVANVSFPEDEWVYGYLLSFGSCAEVLSPESVRNNIKARLEKALGKYC